MAVVKSILIALCALAGVGALVVGILGGLSLPGAGLLPPVAIAEVSLRPFPVLGASAPVVPRPAPPLAADAGVAVGTPAVLDAGVAAPKPVAVDAGTPRPVAQSDAGATAPRPAPVASDAGVRAAPPPPAAPVGEGLLTLRASGNADVFVDGKKVGSSPVDGLKVKAGTHKVRFDCYDAAGNSSPGAPKMVTVAADGEAALDFPCPAPE